MFCFLQAQPVKRARNWGDSFGERWQKTIPCPRGNKQSGPLPLSGWPGPRSHHTAPRGLMAPENFPATLRLIANRPTSLAYGNNGGADSNEPACHAGDLVWIPVRKIPGEGNGNPLQNYCLENPMDRGAWQATVHRTARVGHDSANKPPPHPRSQARHWPSTFHILTH